MTQAFNLSQLANNLNSSGQLDATDGLTGSVPVANGGTGSASLTANNVLLGNGTSAVQVVAPSTSGNFLRSNGTTWVSQAVSIGSGTVTSVATGNGLSGGTITSTGTLVIACPSYHSIGSYVFAWAPSVNISTGANFSGSNASTALLYTNDTSSWVVSSYGSLPGTWKWMAGGTSSGYYYQLGIACRVS